MGDRFKGIFLNQVQNQKRMTLIDGLRGIAALMVVVAHSTGLWDETTKSSYLSAFIHEVISYGRLGVPIFFVLSGFAIAYSVRKAQPTPNWLLKFLLKRLIRLTPPYWVSIGVSVIVLLSRFYLGNSKIPLSPNQFFSNLFYVQGLFAYENLNPVFWTLCIEIQFYIAFGLLIAGLSFISKYWFHSSSYAVIYPFLFIALISLSHPFQVARAQVVPDTKIFTPFWFMFASGVLIWWAIDRKISRQMGWAVVAVLWGFAAISTDDSGSFEKAAALTATLIYLAGCSEKLYSWLNFYPLQFLGLISYSLYIIHLPISTCALGIRSRLSDGSDLANLMLFTAYLTACIFSATVIYQMIEVPSIDWARKINLTDRSSCESKG